MKEFIQVMLFLNELEKFVTFLLFHLEIIGKFSNWKDRLICFHQGMM